MRFLIRCCFWLTLAFLFIPFGTGTGGISGTGDTENESTSVNPIQTLMAARDAVTDIASICERQPAVCETVAAITQTVITRASEGMRLAQQLIDSKSPEKDHPTPQTSIPGNTKPEPVTTGSIQ